MNRRLEHEIRDWLRAERDGPDDLAERALTRVFAQLGRRAPGAAFADRVLLSAGHLVPPVVPWRWRWVRGAVAACLVGSGLALAALPLFWLVLPPLVHAVGSPFMSTLSHSAARWMAAWMRLCAVFADVGTALQSVLVTPTAVALLTANVLLALASLIGLKRLLKAPEEFTPW
jgi:hypothetical protein